VRSSLSAYLRGTASRHPCDRMDEIETRMRFPDAAIKAVRQPKSNTEAGLVLCTYVPLSRSHSHGAVYGTTGTVPLARCPRGLCSRGLAVCRRLSTRLHLFALAFRTHRRDRCAQTMLATYDRNERHPVNGPPPLRLRGAACWLAGRAGWRIRQGGPGCGEGRAALCWNFKYR
jgi:hypothetical protein